jgi:transcriptional regulator with XRE-family HTH domain
MLADRIKILREQAGLTQSEVASMLHISRGSVSSWEMGYSSPQTAFVVQLAKIFNVSTDCILGLEYSTISVEGLGDDEIAILVSTANMFRKNKVDNPHYGNRGKP